MAREGTYSFKDISLGQILVKELAKDRTSPFPSGNTLSNGQDSTIAMLVNLQVHVRWRVVKPPS